MPDSKLHVYSARFEPKPLVGVRFANPDIVEEFEYEMTGRWDRLQEYLDVRAETAECVHNASSESGINLWQHIEAGLITPVRSGVFLPPKPYVLLGLYDASFVTTWANRGLEYEMEVLMKAGYEDAVREAENIMQAGLPSSVAVKKMGRLYADEAGDKLNVRISLYQTGAKNFWRN